MPYKRYVSTVLVGGSSYVGEERARIKRAKPSAARVALKAFSKPYTTRVSNVQVTTSLEELCRSKNWAPPKYTTKCSSDPAKVLGAYLAHSLRANWVHSGYGDNTGSLERVRSQVPQLGLMDRYDVGHQKGSQSEMAYSVTVGEASQQLSGSGRSEQDAKKHAYTTLSCFDAPSERSATEVDSRCTEILRQVCRILLLEPSEDDVMAAILMTRPGYNAEIICIGSGTGFINHENLVKDGEAIFDCHAEVLARRGLEAFLFNQVESASKGALSIVHKDGEKFHLKKGVHFHLFVNKVPCGDACIPLNAKDAGRLRYRKEDGEGNLLKPKDNHRHYKICCSAKIALWNVVGLQGALLAQRLGGPVYLSTIIVKGVEDGCREGQVCKGTLERAFFGRLQGLQGLPPGYSVNVPTVVVLPSDAGAMGGSGRSRHLAVCWAAGCEKEELIETTTGIRKKGDLDVSKRGFANCWASLVPRDKGKVFQKVKRDAGNYQRAKQKFEDCLLQEWIHKSPEYDSFVI